MNKSCDLDRRVFLRSIGYGAITVAAAAWKRDVHGASRKGSGEKLPNILLLLADDWSYPHAGALGDEVVKTFTFDKIAGEGVLFENAFVSAPSCTPSRGAILTGQYHWRLGSAVNLWGSLPKECRVYTSLLEAIGYYIGCTRKAFAPTKNIGWERNPAGPKFKNFKEFMKARPKNKPFCFWFGSGDPHRAYEWKSGVNSGMNIKDVQVAACLPDSEEVRTDICDYYWEVQRFDREAGEILKLIEEHGELDSTLVVITGDNGMPFPGCKATLYDGGTKVPLAIRWPERIKGGQIIKDFVSLTDIAPTFLDACGLDILPEITGRSLMNILSSGKSGQVDTERTFVLTGMETHCTSYPCRAIRTKDYLYIRNFDPGNWDPGTNEYDYNIDPSPSKTYMMEHRDRKGVAPLYNRAFGKRPEEELYDLNKDPGQLNNVAMSPEYATIRRRMAETLVRKLKATKDPRI